MSRFLQIQIYNKNGTEIEYDNYVDDYWGIQTATAKLDTMIMEKELKFGEVYASKFEVQLFGLDEDLSNRKIKVNIITDEETNYIVDDKGNILTTHDNKHLIHHTSTDSDLFFGEIDSTTKDRLGTYRNIVAYDALYKLRDFNMIDFWEDYWSNHEDVSILEFKYAIFNYVGLDYTHHTMINDDYIIHNPVDNQSANVLKFGDLLRNIYQLQNACPHILGNGYITDVTLEGHSDFEVRRDLRGDLEGENSTWEDFVTEQVTGIGVFNTSNTLAQLVGNEGNTYNIVGNLFLLGMSAEEINTICEPLLEHLQDIQYIPGIFKLKLPRKRLNLGDMILTDYGLSYVFSLKFSGAVLINETIECNTKSATLSKDITDINDAQFIGNKYSKIVKDVDGLLIEVGELATDFDGMSDEISDVRSTVEQTAREIVLKVNSSGRIVEVALGIDPASGTEFKVKADNIDLSASDVINLLAGGNLNLTGKNIIISSTNFSVTKDGAITAKSGTIGGFSIGSNNIHNGMTSLDDTTNNGVWLGTNGIALGKGNFKVTSSGALTSKSGNIGGFSIGTDNIHNGMTSLNDTANDGIWLGTNGIALGKGDFKVTTNGTLTAEKGTVASWNISNNKISGGDSSTGVAFMQRPTANTTWVFGAGGTNHQAYADCKFKVSKSGALYSNGLNLTTATETGDNAYGYFAILSSSYGALRVRDKTSAAYVGVYGDRGVVTNQQVKCASVDASGSIDCKSFGATTIICESLVANKTKNRLVTTKDYGERLLYCYETPTPMFGDIGEGKIAEDGKCYVWLDPIFIETVSTDHYQVFLQKYDNGDCWVSERTQTHFVVEGTAGLQFGWEIKARQKDFENKRLETYNTQAVNIPTFNYAEDANDYMQSLAVVDYGENALEHIKEINYEREVA